MALVASHYHWHSSNPTLFLVLLALTALASAVKVRLPGIIGTMSVSFVLILFCVIRLSPGEVVDLAVVSALVQCFWHAQKRPSRLALGYNTSLMVLSTIAAYAAYHVWPASMSLVVTICSAVCAYFLVNTMCVAAAISLTEHKPFLGVWREFYLWSLPFYLFGGSLAASMTFLTRFNWEIGLAVLPLVVITYRTYRVQVKQLEEEKRHAEDMTALHFRTIETLALAVEAKDQTTADHLKRVQVYTSEISKLLKLPEDEKQALQAASILHDVGKIAVPDYIISKPGRLTPGEFQRMKIHPIVGAEIAERIHFPYAVAPIIRAHHEKWDGSGYPYGMRGEEIPIGARILSVVDCFDALASDRQYRKALPLHEAMAVVERESGKSFDPRIVKLLADRYQHLEKLAVAQLSPEQPQLSLDIWVGRGESPDAGFESAASHALPIAGHSSEDGFADFDSDSLNLAETLAVQSCRIAALLPCEAVAFYLLNDNFLTPAYAWGVEVERLSRLRINLGDGVAGWVAEHHKPILNGNPTVEPGYAQAAPGAGALRSVLAVPLQTDSETLGVLALYSAKPDGFTRDTLDRILSFSGKISASIQRAIEKEAGSKASANYATSLPNSRALLSCLDAEIAKKSSLAVVHCQVAGIAEIHESFGRDSADETLRAIAAALQQCCRDVDYLAQTAEDEFALVLSGVNFQMAQLTIESLRRAAEAVGLKLWGADLVSLKAGAACFPDHAAVAKALVNEARRAMLAFDLTSLASLASADSPKTQEPIPS